MKQLFNDIEMSCGEETWEKVTVDGKSDTVISLDISVFVGFPSSVDYLKDELL